MKYANKIDLVANEYQCISFASIEPKIDKIASKRDVITFLGLFTVILITIEILVLVYCGAWWLFKDVSYPLLSGITAILLIFQLITAKLLSKKDQELKYSLQDDFKFMGLQNLDLLSHKHTLEKYFKDEITTERYEKIKVISDFSTAFYKKAQEVLKYRNSIITDFDYAAMDCEKLYAEVLRLKKQAEIQNEKNTLKKEIFNI